MLYAGQISHQLGLTLLQLIERLLRGGKTLSQFGLVLMHADDSRCGCIREFLKAADVGPRTLLRQSVLPYVWRNQSLPSLGRECPAPPSSIRLCEHQRARSHEPCQWLHLRFRKGRAIHRLGRLSACARCSTRTYRCGQVPSLPACPHSPRSPSSSPSRLDQRRRDCCPATPVPLEL